MYPLTHRKIRDIDIRLPSYDYHCLQQIIDEFGFEVGIRVKFNSLKNTLASLFRLTKFRNSSLLNFQRIYLMFLKQVIIVTLFPLIFLRYQMGSFFFFFLYFSVFRLCILVERSCKTTGNNATIRAHEDAIMNRKHAAYKTRDPFGLADVAYLFKGLTLELKFVQVAYPSSAVTIVSIKISSSLNESSRMVCVQNSIVCLFRLAFWTLKCAFFNIQDLAWTT